MSSEAEQYNNDGTQSAPAKTMEKGGQRTDKRQGDRHKDKAQERWGKREREKQINVAMQPK